MHQQIFRLVSPEEIAYGKENDDLRKRLLSQFKQQTSLAIDHRIRFLKHSRSKTKESTSAD